MDICLPSEYYGQFCESFESGCNDRILMQFQLIDEAITTLMSHGINPVGRRRVTGDDDDEADVNITYTQEQLMEAFFTPDGQQDGATNRNRRAPRSREASASVKAAAQACLCLTMGPWFCDEDVDAVGATIRATMPFLFSLALCKCRHITDRGVRMLDGYLFHIDEDDNDDDDPPDLRHYDVATCSQLTPATGEYFSALLGSAMATTGCSLVAVRLSRAAMDGHMDTIATHCARRMRSVADDDTRHKMGLIISIAEENMKAKAAIYSIVDARVVGEPSRHSDDDGVGGGGGGGLDEVSYHEMEIDEAALLGGGAAIGSSTDAPNGSRGLPMAVSRTLVNDAHDEVWYPSDDDVAAEDVPTPTRGTPRGGVPTQLLPTPTKLNALSHRGQNATTRTVIDGQLSSDLIDLFAMIEQYHPEEMALDKQFMKFHYPGPIHYFPAVHAPDPMLAPDLPGPLTKKSARKDSSSAVAEPPVDAPLVPRPPPTAAPSTTAATPEAPPGDRPSMFTSFFRSAQSSRTNSPRTPRGAGGTLGATILPRPPLTARGPPSQSASASSVAPLSARTGRNTNPRRQSLLNALAAAQSIASQTAGSASDTLAAAAVGQPTLLMPMPPSAPPPIPALNLARVGGEEDDTEDGNQDPTTASPAQKPLGGDAYDPDRHVDPLTYALGYVNDAVVGSKMSTSSRPLQLPTVSRGAGGGPSRQQGLAAQLDDVSFNPLVPSRGDMIERSLAKHKLNYNVVKSERRRDVPDWMNTRTYVAELLIKPSKAETLSSGSMNEDGTLLATTHYDMTCKVWRAETGELLHNLQGHTNHLSDCAWNAPFCTKIVTSSFDKTLRVWDAKTGESLHCLVGHELEVVCLAVAPNGLLCASGGMDDLAIIWDIEKGEELFNLLGHEGEVIALDFSPCGEKLVTGSMDETVRVWSVLNGTQLHKFEGHTAEVNQVKFNCYGNMILSGSIDTTCRLWDVNTGQARVLRGHTHEVVDCDFSPDGWSCASASDDSTVRIWDVLTGGCTMLLVGHTQGVCRLLYTPDGGTIVTGSLDSTARVWNVTNGECKQTLTGHKGLVIASYNPATDRVITMSRDNTCRLWRLEAPQNNLVAMAALAIGRDRSVFNASMEARGCLPNHLASMLRNFYSKLHVDEKPKALGHVPGGGSAGNPHGVSRPEIPSATDEATPTHAPARPTVDDEADDSGADDNDEEGEGSTARTTAVATPTAPLAEGPTTTRVVNLRARSRIVEISPLDEIRVE